MKIRNLGDRHDGLVQHREVKKKVGVLSKARGKGSRRREGGGAELGAWNATLKIAGSRQE